MPASAPPDVSMGGVASRARATASFRVLHVRFGAGLSLPRHHHELANFVFPLRGHFQRHSARGPLDCCYGVAFTEPAGEPHANEFGDQGADVLIVQPGPAWDGRPRRERRLFESPSTFHDPSLLVFATRLAAEVSADDSFARLAIDGLGLQLLATALRSDGAEHRRAPWMSRVIEMLRDDHAGELTIDTLALETGIGAGYLARSFRSHHGVSLARFARNLRLSQAAIHLGDVSRSIGRISIEAGFVDQSHFTRAFKQVYGITPGAYRRALSHRGS